MAEEASSRHHKKKVCQTHLRMRLKICEGKQPLKNTRYVVMRVNNRILK